MINLATDPDFVTRAMERAVPLDFELLGEDAIRHYMDGGRFDGPGGGRDFDVTTSFDMLGHVVTVITLAQYAYVALKKVNPGTSQRSTDVLREVNQRIDALPAGEQPKIEESAKETVCNLVVEAHGESP